MISPGDPFQGGIVIAIDHDQRNMTALTGGQIRRFRRVPRGHWPISDWHDVTNGYSGTRKNGMTSGVERNAYTLKLVNDMLAVSEKAMLEILDDEP